MDAAEILANYIPRSQAEPNYYAEKEVLSRYGPMFQPDALHRLGKEDFKSFLLFKNNKHWSGIHRFGNILTQDMKRLQDALRILVDESRPLQQRLNTLFTPDGSNYIKGLGPATATPILYVAYPEKYGVYNAISFGAFEKLRLLPSHGVSFVQEYSSFNQKLHELAKRLNLSLWQLDWVLWAYLTDVQDQV